MNVSASRPANRGFFLSFEGIDGAGKSTHIDALAAVFRAQGLAVTQTREPGGTPLAEKLRQMVLGDAMDPLTESLLIFAARRDLGGNLIEHPVPRRRLNPQPSGRKTHLRGRRFMRMVTPIDHVISFALRCSGGGMADTHV